MNQQPTPDVDQDVEPKPKLLKKTRLRRIVSMMFILTIMVGAWLLFLTRTNPSYWTAHEKEMSQLTSKQAQQMVAEVTRKLAPLPAILSGPASAFSNPESDQYEPDDALRAIKISKAVLDAMSPAELARPRKIKMTTQEVNSFLLEKLGEWTRYRDYKLPKEIKKPCVIIDDENLIIGFLFDSEHFTQVFTAPITTEFLDTGKAKLHVLRYYAGRLKIPVNTLGDFIGLHLPKKSKANKAAKWIDKLKELEFSPVIKLPTRYKARVLGYRILSQTELEVTIRLERPTQY